MLKRGASVAIVTCFGLFALLIGYWCSYDEPQTGGNFHIEFCVPVTGTWDSNTYFDSASIAPPEDGILTVFIKHYEFSQVSLWGVTGDLEYKMLDTSMEYVDRDSGSVTWEKVTLDVSGYVGDVILRAQFNGGVEKSIRIEITGGV